MDLFEEYLEKKHTNQRVIRALTAESCKNKDHSLENKDVATDLATLVMR